MMMMMMTIIIIIIITQEAISCRYKLMQVIARFDKN